MKYNQFIIEKLNAVSCEDEFVDFLEYLHDFLRRSNDVPWK